MSHHDDDFRTTPIPEAIRQALHKPLIGATGEHPEGKLNASDEGGIQFAVGVKDGKVCLDFASSVARNESRRRARLSIIADRACAQSRSR